MAIDLYLDASAKRIAGYLLNLRPDGALGSWEVESYQIAPRIYGTAIRLSILAEVRRPGAADMLTATVLLQELDTDRCILSLSANPTLVRTGSAEAAKEDPAHGWEPEIALFAWLLGKSRRAWPEIDDQLAELAAELAPADVIDGGEDTVQNERPKPGRFGTDRDLSHADVLAICRRVRDHQERGGRVTDWYRDYASQGGPGSYELETLRGWLKDPRFDERPRKVT